MNDDIRQVEAMDSGKKNSEVLESTKKVSTVIMGGGTTSCFWNDEEFSDGTRVCEGGVAYECQMGRWLKLKIEC
ncbi:hypothetical protein ACFL4N_05290 [Thermodesulfobacteriota bacterium]